MRRCSFPCAPGSAASTYPTPWRWSSTKRGVSWASRGRIRSAGNDGAPDAVPPSLQDHRSLEHGHAASSDIRCAHRSIMSRSTSEQQTRPTHVDALMYAPRELGAFAGMAGTLAGLKRGEQGDGRRARTPCGRIFDDPVERREHARMQNDLIGRGGWVARPPVCENRIRAVERKEFSMRRDIRRRAAQRIAAVEFGDQKRQPDRNY